MTQKLHKHKNDTELREILHEIYAKKTHKLHKHNAKFTRNFTRKAREKDAKSSQTSKKDTGMTEITQKI